MNSTWSWYVIVLTAINIIGLIWLLVATASSDPSTTSRLARPWAMSGTAISRN